MEFYFFFLFFLISKYTSWSRRTPGFAYKSNCEYSCKTFQFMTNYPQILKLIYEERAIVFRDRKCQASCSSSFHCHFAVHNVDLWEVLNMYLRKELHVWERYIHELGQVYFCTFAYVLVAFIITKGKYNALHIEITIQISN